MLLIDRVSALATAVGVKIKQVEANSGGGSSAIIAEIVLDFGDIGSKYKLFTISDSNLTSGKKITNIVYKPTSNKLVNIVKESIDDDEFDSIDFSIRNSSVGSFQILAKSNGIINNYKTIQYTIQ